jgi:hypothetical protein
MSITKGKRIFHYDSVRKLLDSPSYFKCDTVIEYAMPGI